jgi:NAD(P)-dependent dehydrogenase (short-subunit alcohol dehydrogenase family)
MPQGYAPALEGSDQKVNVESTQSVILTGASSGIGTASALLLAEQGYDGGLTYRRNEDGARPTAKAIKALGRSAAIAQLGDELGRIDAVANNAGVNRRAEALEETVEGWNRTLAVDLVAPRACAKAAAKRIVIERPVIRAAGAEEAAAAVAFLVSEQASYVTCASLLVDGGLALASRPQQLEQLTDLAAEGEVTA